MAKQTGLLGWPLAPSTHFPGEMTLSCPNCFSTNITILSVPMGRGTGPNGRFRMGDPSKQAVRCERCKRMEVEN